MTHVYVIQAEGGPVKVGMANDPMRRLLVLQTASFSRLSLYFAGLVSCGRASQVEAEAHRRLSGARKAGEWFETSAAAAVDALIGAAHDLGIVLRDREPGPIPRIARDHVIVSDITSEQVRAARMLLRWEQKDLAGASGVSLPTVKRLEAKPGVMSAQGATIRSLQRALEAAGVEFTNGSQPGVRLARKAD